MAEVYAYVDGGYLRETRLGRRAPPATNGPPPSAVRRKAAAPESRGGEGVATPTQANA